MKTKCNKCGYEWDYKGKRQSTEEIPAYTTCPSCRANVKVPVSS